MTLTIEVAPDKEACLREKAARLGVPLEEYLLDLAERDAQAPAGDEDEVAARLALLDEWEREVAARPDLRAQAGLGPLPDDAVADVYREREDAQP